MDQEALRRWIEDHGEESFSRSSGPGGQNVNKTSTKALLRVSIPLLGGITEPERARLLVKLAGKLTAEGDLVVQAQDERSQGMNRDLAIERVIALVVQGLHRPKPRHKTKPTKASQERRLTAKRVASNHKRNRSIGDD
ncbi:MAG TPA: alternative ribosome rescue aminoacyl-tRNA hydrolase ArfB [Spirochaetia bacterium]|jgi:ribosome-associated protein|nr:alternative ribosome rescue aminoacyl-tRNA hydrolase ArfB [Spirochaetia bacterium]